MDHLYQIIYCESNGHMINGLTLPTNGRGRGPKMFKVSYLGNFSRQMVGLAIVDHL